MTVGSAEASLVARFRSGSPEATAAMYARYGKLVYAVAWRVLGERGAAEDATQQTFVQAWRHAADLDAEREPAPWLATIARRVAIDVARHRGRRPGLVDASAEVGEPTEEGPDAERLWHTWRVREEIERLDDNEREVVRLQHQLGLSHSEISERLHVPVGTVKSRSFRAHRHLAAALADLRAADEREPTAGDRRTQRQGGAP
jgi:RNA polymerase sigma-70 factor, ECF subfamily